ncbi:MAG: hypothetical protein IJZ89_06880 [Clostridia bacterium]|nr:hypothetical protein [Clostridia bacterium]
MSDEAFNKLLFRIMFGRKADFENPKSFSEFVCARKLRDDAFDLYNYTDKYEAREYVGKAVGDQYLNECYGVYERFEDIDFEALPDKFALRGTHGSGYNIVVTDKSCFDRRDAAKKFKKWLGKNYYHRCRERNYFKIKPRICCDKFLECENYDGLPEMKVFCFGGKAKFVCYNLCKDGKTYTNMYDENWNYLDIRKGYEHFEDKSVPENSKEIFRIAETLAKPFDFVRVDLYNVDGRIIFSELTFFTGGGFVPFDPPEYDEKFASYFRELEKTER